jgi:hypothetical protein
MRTNKRIRRPCISCEKMFIKHGQFSKLCSKCYDASKQKEWKKRKSGELT